jgi:hypothetical protein
MNLNYIAYLPEHQDELELLGEAYSDYFFSILSGSGSGDWMTEKEFIFNRASPELLRALKELEVKSKINEIEQDFEQDKQ